jgi:DNA uptake protein ComE-like DNA-binding protein
MISVLVLTIMAGVFAFRMKVETTLARNANNEVELEWLGRSGVEYAKWIVGQQLTVQGEPYDAANQVWAGGAGGIGTTNSALTMVEKEVHLGHGSFTWKITDLESKYNINVASEAILQQSLIVSGMDAADLPAIVGSVLDWIDPDNNTHVQGAENDYYHGLMIKNITSDIYWGSASTNHPIGLAQQTLNSHGQPVVAPVGAGLADIFTPISGGKLNINTASASVLQLIPGVDAMRAEAIVAAREGEDDGSGLTGPYRNASAQYLFNRVPGLGLEVARQVERLGDVRSRSFQVEIDAQIGGYHRIFIATIARNNPRDVQLLNFYWK